MAIQRIPSLSDIDFPPHALIIADEGLPPHLFEALTTDQLIRVPAGEALKRLSAIEELAAQVLSIRATRPLILVALGGGSIGDAVGFLASILWRGVALWHIPTTLLAMVDSAHGGKTAINLDLAKNQLGTFHLASEIFLVDDVLAALPLPRRREGLAEVIKGLWIGDAPALEFLEAEGGVEELANAPFDTVRNRLWKLIERAIAVKEQIIEQDLDETRGLRTVLNLGHSVAHALELREHLPHGEAVAWGLGCVAEVSTELAGLAPNDATRLRDHIHPLLSAPLPGFPPDQSTFEAILARDKKRQDGALRSVLLDEPGAVVVTTRVHPSRWFEALLATRRWWMETPLHIQLIAPRPSIPQIPASKSVLNRLLAIAHQRPGHTDIDGISSADDVRTMKHALAHLTDPKDTPPDLPLSIHCGLGGTTFRFLLAIAANRRGITRLYAAEELLRRPHSPLIEALSEGGARIEPFEDPIGSGLIIEGWKTPPTSMKVSCAESSQFASAIALLSSTGQAIDLELIPGPRGIVSRPYLELTLDLLKHAGVHVTWQTPTHLRLRSTTKLNAPMTLHAPADASCVALWHVIKHLNPSIEVNLPDLDLAQPDSAIVQILERFSSAEGGSPIIVDMTHCPDLTPILCALSLSHPSEVRFQGAGHLRFKESNRIESFAESLAEIGLRIDPAPDGLTVPAGIQHPRSNASLNPQGDHRLAMVALVLSATGATLRLTNPMVMTKSYPTLWDDARAAGWSIAPGPPKITDVPR